MPEFIYKAQTKEGKIVEGKIDAGSENQAITTLHSRDLVVFPLNLKQEVWLREISAGFFKEYPTRMSLSLRDN